MNNLKKRVKELEKIRGNSQSPDIIIYSLVESAWAEGGHAYTQEEVDAFLDSAKAKNPGQSVFIPYWDGFKFR